MGTLGIVDFDVVDESNLQRQVIHGVVRHRQAQGASRRKESVAEINPLVEVILHEERLDSDNALDIFARRTT